MVKGKENSCVVAKDGKSSSGSLSTTKKPLLKSNQSSLSKSSAEVTLEKSLRTLRSSLLSKNEKPPELASRKIQAAPKAKAVSGTKGHPIVLSSGGESDHEAPLPLMCPQTRTSELKEDTIEQPAKKPKATIKPFQIKKKVSEPMIMETKCLGEVPKEDEAATMKKHESSLPLVEKQPKEQIKKVSGSTIAPAKCQGVASSQKKASSAPLVEKPLTKQTVKPPPTVKNTRPKKANAPTKRVFYPVRGPAAIPPPPRPPPSFSHYTHHLQARPHYIQSYYDHHSQQPAPYCYQYQSYNDYSHWSYPESSHSTHPLATSHCAAPYYHYQ